MGGGDLNTKKSWHPNTMKNQERVWKAEQAAAEEKKRIVELQQERAQEHDRAALNELAQRNYGQSDNRLHWMYDKPDKPGQHEDYLLGKEVGKIDSEHTQQNTIPAVSRRVVGSSMNTTLDDTQVDLARKLREDPLLLVKERERAARAALLNNPLQRKKLTELLRREKEKKESKQQDSKAQKKAKKNIDSMLAAKLNALGGEKGIDLNSLLNSDDSSSESAEDEKPKKKKKRKKSKKSKKAKKKSSKSDTDSSDDESDKDTQKISKHDRYTSETNQRKSESSHYDGRPDKLDCNKHKSYKHTESEDYHKKTSKSNDSKYGVSTSDNTKKKHESEHTDKYRDRKRRTDSYSDSDTKKKSRRDITEHNRDRKRNNSFSDSDERNKTSRDKKRRSASFSDGDKKAKKDHSEQKNMERYKQVSPNRKKASFPPGRKERKSGLSEAERAAKLAEMTAAGQAREIERGRRVASQRAQDAAVESAPKGPRSANNQARALPDSLEDRIRSNRHYIQRDKMHMGQHFARR